MQAGFLTAITCECLDAPFKSEGLITSFEASNGLRGGTSFGHEGSASRTVRPDPHREVRSVTSGKRMRGRRPSCDGRPRPRRLALRSSLEALTTSQGA